jgi:hypothetical protein
LPWLARRWTWWATVCATFIIPSDCPACSK